MIRKIFVTMLLISAILNASLLHVSAYIDPSTSTYIIQAIAGVVIAGGAAFAVYWKKIKLFFKKKKLKKQQETQKEQ